MIKVARKRRKGKLKKVWLILGLFILLIMLSIGTYFFMLTAPQKEKNLVTFTVSPGMSKLEIVDNLKSAGLIRSKTATLIYLSLLKNNNVQAASYEVSRDMNVKEIVEKLVSGDAIKKRKDTVQITFKEGITIKQFINLVSTNMGYSEDDIKAVINDKTFLQELIEKYSFLSDDILKSGIYYPLEGYMYPDTYEFYKDAGIQSIITNVLDETESKYSQLMQDVQNSGKSFHEILTIASIIEKEAVVYLDRTMVSQVIYTRLARNMSLGMDVTSYYGVQKDMTDVITYADLNNNNPYNTRVTSFLGLPIGPICNPSLESIKAALNPADTDYIYFFADIKTGKVYFTNSAEEFESFKNIYG